MQPKRGDENPILHAIVAIDELLGQRRPVDNVDKEEFNKRLSRLKPHEALSVYDFALSKIEPSMDSALRREISGQYVEIEAFVADHSGPDVPMSEGCSERYPEVMAPLLDNISTYLAKKAVETDGKKHNVSIVSALLSHHATAHAAIADVVASSMEMLRPEGGAGSDDKAPDMSGDNVVSFAQFKSKTSPGF